MNVAEKITYLKDYYLLKIIIILSIIGILSFLVWAIFLRPRVETALYVAIIDEVLDEEAKEELEDRIRALLDVDTTTQQVVLDDSFYMEEDGLTKLEVYLSAGQVDAVLASEEVFVEFAGYGFFQNLEAILSRHDQKVLQSDILQAAGYLEHDEDRMDDLETGQGSVLPYGVRVPKNSRWKTETGALTEDAVCSIAEGARNVGNAIEFMKYIHARDDTSDT